ncbi:MAG: DinB family protein [Desulfovibrio sp.]
METLRLFLGYHYDATARQLKSARGVSELLHRPLDCAHGSLFGLLAHIVGVDRLWGLRIREGLSLDHVPGADDFADLDALEAALQEQQQAMTAFLLVISHTDLARTVSYRSTKGAKHTEPLGGLLLHMVNHGTHHRAEFAVLMRLLGHPLPDDDFLLALREPDRTR